MAFNPGACGVSRKPARSQELGLFAQRLYIEFSILFCYFFFFKCREGCWFLFSPLQHSFLGFSHHQHHLSIILLLSHHGPDEPPCAGGGLLQKHEVPHHPQPHQCHAEHLLGGSEEVWCHHSCASVRSDLRQDPPGEGWHHCHGLAI